MGMLVNGKGLCMSNKRIENVLHQLICVHCITDKAEGGGVQRVTGYALHMTQLSWGHKQNGCCIQLFISSMCTTITYATVTG